MDETRFLYQRGNNVYDNPIDLDLLGYPMNIIDESGSSFEKADSMVIVYDEVQPIYDQYYEELEEAYMNAE